jgi:hypothetical protein
MTIQSILSEVEETPVDEQVLKAFSSEGQHYGMAFDLFRESASCVCILASTTIGNGKNWNIQQAVLGGHLVRMFKLMRFVMEESIEHRDELLSVLVRLLAECVINTRYLIQESSEELITSYLAYSLRHEKDLADLIRGNVRDRGGDTLPIEERMLRSIQKTFENSKFPEANLPEKKVKNWGNKNLYEKAQTVGLANAYLAVFGGPSRNVHGGWQDLLQYHLDCEAPGEFTAKLEFSRPRPQAVYSLTHLISETLIGYAAMLNHPAVDPVAQRVESIIHRNQLASKIHEQYLQERGG